MITRRPFQIFWVFAKHLLFRSGALEDGNFGKHLCDICCELGPTFIKMGQILSMRYDLLSDKNRNELQKLLEDVNPIAFETIEKILISQWGKGWRKKFRRFNKKPIASASISQVYKAVLKNGEVVAVKIKRPDIRAQIARDIRVLRIWANIGHLLSPTLRQVRIRHVVQSFEDWLKKETDFRQEVRNIELIHEQYEFCTDVKTFRSDLGIMITPHVHPKLCTDEVIVMEFIDGVPMSQYKIIEKNPKYDIQKSIKTYVNAGTRSLFHQEKYTFQADPHLSNVLILPNGDVANVDCGLIEQFDEEATKLGRDFFLSVYLEDFEGVIRTTLGMAGMDSTARTPALESDIREFLIQSRDEGIGFWFLETVKIAFRHKIYFPISHIAYGRCNIVIDGLIQEVFPGISVKDLLGKELEREIWRKAVDNLAEIDMIPLLYKITEKAKTAPQFLTEVIENPEKALVKLRDLWRG